MKKLITLVMVLGIASLASAALLDDIQLRMDTPGVVIIEGLVATDAYAAAGFGVYVPGGAMDPVVEGPLEKYIAAGDAAAISQWAGYNGVDVAPAWSGVAGEPEVLAGDWFSFGYAGNAGDLMEIFDYSVSATVPVGALTIMGVPEPATMALLGLGALVLRRKK